MAGPRLVRAADWRRQTWRPLPAIGTPVPAFWVHHSGAGPKTFATLLANERYHVRSRGWRALGYSFAVVAGLNDGGFARIFEGRGWGREGGHTAGQNVTSHGVLLVGGWQTATPSQIEAAARSVAWLVADGARRGVQVRTVSGGHRDAPGAATACPGAAGMTVMRRARSLLSMPVSADVEVDMSLSSWAESSWRKARARGVVSADSVPKASVTYEQLVVLLDRAGVFDSSVAGGVSQADGDVRWVRRGTSVRLP